MRIAARNGRGLKACTGSAQSTHATPEVTVLSPGQRVFIVQSDKSAYLATMFGRPNRCLTLAQTLPPPWAVPSELQLKRVSQRMMPPTSEVSAPAAILSVSSTTAIWPVLSREANQSCVERQSRDNVECVVHSRDQSCYRDDGDPDAPVHMAMQSPFTETQAFRP